MIRNFLKFRSSLTDWLISSCVAFEQWPIQESEPPQSIPDSGQWNGVLLWGVGYEPYIRQSSSLELFVKVSIFVKKSSW